MTIKTIDFQGVEFYYEGSERVFSNLSFSFPMDRIVRIRGALGSGSSTLLKILATLLKPKLGAFQINGFDVHSLTREEFRPYQLKIGYGFEQGGLLHNRTLRQNLGLPLDFHATEPMEERELRVRELMEAFQLSNAQLLRPSLASSGTQKACLVARAFVMHPELLLLDNPTRGLNGESREALIRMIRLHQRERGLRHVILASDDSELFDCFDHVVLDIVNRSLVQSDPIPRVEAA